MISGPTGKGRSVAVVGGGIVGTMTALAAAERGWSVTVLEREDALWSAASATNEGKVHLGLVYARADDATVRTMLGGALSFSRACESIIGRHLDWSSLRTQPFDYVLAPDSSLSAEQMLDHAARVGRILKSFSSSERDNYLGMPIDEVASQITHVHDGSGLTAIRTAELAVDPRLLGGLMTREVEERDLIRVEAGVEVQRLESHEDDASVITAEGTRRRYDVVVNCAGSSQEALLGSRAKPRNYRLKTAVLVDETVPGPPMTIVHGAFGDVVPYARGSYLSWYPVARLSNEFAVQPSPETMRLRSEVPTMTGLAELQIAKLAELGVIAGGLTVTKVIGDLIIADGHSDIDSRRSALHRRSRFGVRTDGRVITPISLKLTTAPEVVQLTIGALGRFG